MSRPATLGFVLFAAWCGLGWLFLRNWMATRRPRCRHCGTKLWLRFAPETLTVPEPLERGQLLFITGQCPGCGVEVRPQATTLGQLIDQEAICPVCDEAWDGERCRQCNFQRDALNNPRRKPV